MGKTKLDIKGWDWAELAPLTGKSYDDYESDEAAAEAIREFISEAAFKDCGEGDAEVAASVRQFLEALENDGMAGYSKPFYRGLREIEHDGMMLQYVSHFLDWLWT